jgi:hypothetical protein
MFKNALTEKIVEFLKEIGLEIEPRSLDKETFLPGILIENGKICVDEEKLAFPGDLLHEAGHLAVVPGDLRGQLSDEVELPDFFPDTIEAAAMAWSYAAALYLEIDPRIVFHKEGYKGNSAALLQNFTLGAYIGVNELEEAKMTRTGENAMKSGTSAYPKMIKWLRD